MKKEWKPWETYKQDSEIITAIKKPPCQWCKFWKPQRKYKESYSGIEFNGIVCCHASEMHSDFSCFKK